MSDLDKDLKEKPKRRGRQFPADFVIPLQLEECLYRIENTPDRYEFKIRVKPDTTSSNVDEAELTALCDPYRQGDVQAEGKLRRWEGTSTRFEGKLRITVVHPGIFMLLLLMTFLYPIPAYFAVTIIVALFYNAKLTTELNIILMISPAVPYPLMLMALNRWNNRLTYQKFRKAFGQHLKVESEI